MKVLVLCGDYWHPPAIAREGLQALPGTDFEFDFIEDARAWSPAQMMSYPLVVLTKSNNVTASDQTEWMTDDAQAAFAEYVLQGRGLLAIHSGTAEYEQKLGLRGLLGGVFLRHPEQCPVTIRPRPGHPLCEGADSFALKDEHYFMALDDPQADVFLTTSSAHGEQPGAWRREVGQGRVAVLTPGHHLAVWLHPAYQALIRNALRWCGR